MAVFFTVGEQKERPGVYQRYENHGGIKTAGAMNGYGAVIFKGNWGPLGEVMTFETSSQVANILGSGGEGGTVDAITKMFEGGTAVVYAVRLGAEGAKGTLTLSGVDVTAKYEGSRPLSVSVKSVLGNDGVKQLKVYEGTKLLETVEFAKTAEALLGANSNFLVFGKNATYDATAEVEVVEATALAGGADPESITVEDYSKAMDLLEGYDYNVIVTDSESVEVHAVLNSYVKRVHQDGKLIFGVVAEPTSVAFETRKSHAAAFNTEGFVYVGDGIKTAAGDTIDGYRAGALLAGIIASVPSNQSITHYVIAGAVEVAETKKNTAYVEATKSGMITFSASPDGQIWVESGITTLVTPDENQDDGWKKIKRTKIRYELMTRVDQTIAAKIGKINNNADGRAEIIIAVNGLLEKMYLEDKLIEGGYCEVDPENAPEGDSAWFVIYADDVDSLEKVYFVYKFRFSPNV